MSDRTFFWHRLRWRFRGAWTWPAFALLTLLDGILLWRLPPVDTGLNIIEGLLLATFGNLILVAAVAPWLAGRMAARRKPPPSQAERELLRDRVGTAVLAAGVFGVLASGLATRPLVVAETEATEEAAKALHSYVQNSGNEELIRNEETANKIRLSDGFFRICIAHDDRERFFCFFVDTDKEPTEIRRDPCAESNSVYKVP